MGKKKGKKTKEVSVGMVEASASIPRKRGRPRKIVEEIESKEREDQKAEAEEAEDDLLNRGGLSKRAKTSEEQIKNEGTTSSMEGMKMEEEEQTEEREASKQPPKARGRRKSKPRKSI